MLLPGERKQIKNNFIQKYFRKHSFYRVLFLYFIIIKILSSRYKQKTNRSFKSNKSNKTPDFRTIRTKKTITKF